MAKKKQIGRRVEGWKAKSWYKVYVPESFGSTPIGETIAADSENLVGRVMSTTLGEISQDFAKQHIKMKFKISRVAGDAAYTEFIGHELTKDYLRSLVKRRTSRIDSHIMGSTKDGKRIHLTVTCYTLIGANSSQIHAIRKVISTQMAAFVVQNDWATVVDGIVTGSISRDLVAQVKGIFPIRRVEVIKSKIESKVIIV